MEGFAAAWLAVAATTVAAFWRTALTVVEQLRGRVIATVELEGHVLCAAAREFLWQQTTPSRYSARSFTGWLLRRNDTGRDGLIPLERIGASRLFWCGWRPLWVMTPAASPPASGPAEEKITFYYLRGTLDVDGLLAGLAHDYDEARTDYLSQHIRRHYVRTVTGTADASQAAGATPRFDHDGPDTRSQWDARQYRPVGVPRDAILPRPTATMSLAALSLTAEAEGLVSDVAHWLQSRDWYKARGVPWRHGVALVGSPGVGKTSLVRAIAEERDLPVWLFDLRTLRNSELRVAWSEMSGNTPCIALMEDFDVVFAGRSNAVTQAGLSFDCLLNCMDGVQQTEGVLLVVTTNNAETLDPALLRPGRLDRTVCLGPLSQAGRQKLANRILLDYPELIQEAVSKTDGLPAAVVQDVFCRMALDKLWTPTKRERDGENL